MPEKDYEIRVCESCGLRYPLLEGHPFGVRCPVCMGTTQLILHRELVTESPSQVAPDRNVHVPGARARPSSARLAVLLDNIRSAWNVGSILRSADGFGFTHAYLCGITPTADHESVSKTALGAEDSVPWSYHKDAVRLVKGLKAQGWAILALEDDPAAVDVHQSPGLAHNFRHSVLILGSEVSGVDPGLLELCDHIFYIPMQGLKRSLNVAIAFGIAAFALSLSRVEK